MNQLTGIATIILIIFLGTFTFFLFKKKNSYGYITLYLFVWLIFGCFYWIIATFSTNDVFIFEEHVKLNSISKIIYKKLDQIYNIEDIKKIIKSNSHKIQAINLKADNNRNIAFCDKNIGEAWAELYINYYKKRGYTHYSHKLISVENDPKELLYFKPMEEVIFENKFYNPTKLYKYQITLYKTLNKLDKENFGEKSNFGNMEAKETIFIWTTKKINNITKNNKEIYFIPIKYGLKSIISFSFSMPNQSIWTFKKVEMGKIPFPIIDFLYFSAVTITTLGYGDILPNSSLTRSFVMLESLLGLIIIGIFISTILERRNFKKN